MSMHPRIMGRVYRMAMYAIAFFHRETRCTPVNIVIISMEPSTHPRRVVWSVVNPKDETMISRSGFTFHGSRQFQPWQ